LIGDVVGLMGFDENFIAISQEIVWLLIALNIVCGITDGYGDFLEGKSERYATRTQFLSTVIAMRAPRSWRHLKWSEHYVGEG
jgi:hypothetical protein